MSETRRDANLKSLKKTEEVQGKTKEALRRISKDIEETTELGNTTLEKLKAETEQMVCQHLYL